MTAASKPDAAKIGCWTLARKGHGMVYYVKTLVEINMIHHFFVALIFLVIT